MNIQYTIEFENIQAINGHLEKLGLKLIPKLEKEQFLSKNTPLCSLWKVENDFYLAQMENIVSYLKGCFYSRKIISNGCGFKLLKDGEWN